MDFAQKLDDIQFEDEVIDVDPIPSQEYYKDGKVICLICKKTFNYLNTTHLIKHGMTTAQYSDKFPNAPFRIDKKLLKTLPIDKKVYVDAQGVKRNMETGHLVSAGRALRNSRSKLNMTERTFKDYANSYSESLFIFLSSIVEYDSVKMNHKKPIWTNNDKLKAADMIIKMMPKPATERVTESTVKTLKVSIGGTLPDQYSPEDF